MTPTYSFCKIPVHVLMLLKNETKLGCISIALMISDMDIQPAGYGFRSNNANHRFNRCYFLHLIKVICDLRKEIYGRLILLIPHVTKI